MRLVLGLRLPEGRSLSSNSTLSDPRFSIGLVGQPDVGAGRGAEQTSTAMPPMRSFLTMRACRVARSPGAAQHRPDALRHCGTSTARALSSSCRRPLGSSGPDHQALAEASSPRRPGDPPPRGRRDERAWLRRAVDRALEPRELPEQLVHVAEEPERVALGAKGRGGIGGEGLGALAEQVVGSGRARVAQSSPTAATVRRRLSAPKEATFSPFSSTSENSASRTRRGTHSAVPAMATPGALPSAGPSRRASDRSVVRS